MEQQMTSILDRLKLSLRLCDYIVSSAGIISQPITQLRSRLEHMITQHHLSPATSTEEISSVRGQIAQLRTEIIECSSIVEQMQTQSAEYYRSLLGDGKEEFERFSEPIQQNVNPQAYHTKKAFHQLAQLSELLTLITADLLNLGGELEHHILKTKPSPEVGHFDYQDNVPAPPTLSP